MANFFSEFKKGQSGKNKGLNISSGDDGLQKLNLVLNGLQQGRIIGVAAPPKAGKSTLVNEAFVINPILDALTKDISVKYYYYSLEIDRISVEFDFITYFLHKDYGITEIELEEGITRKGKNTVELSPNYIRGRVMDDNGEIILIKDQSFIDNIKNVYQTRIIPLLGRYNSNGDRVSRGIIDFIELKDNPTGYYKEWLAIAEENGKFKHRVYGKTKRIVGYTPDDPSKYVVIVFDHIRKIMTERGWQMKQSIDKLIEYMVEVRNLTNFSFVPIIHTNRNLVDVSRLKYADDIYPTSDDIKDTGNLAEDADAIITVFNPNDKKYSLSTHFGIEIRDKHGNELFPNLRTIHLVENRHGEFPVHYKTNMYGNLKTFKKLE